jgi:hypothetical protein
MNELKPTTKINRDIIYFVQAIENNGKVRVIAFLENGQDKYFDYNKTPTERMLDNCLRHFLDEKTF